MIFPTIEFGIFFLIVFAISWAVRGLPEARKLFLVGASYFFYAWWDWRFLGLLFLSTLISYLGGLAVARAERDGLRKVIVGVSTVSHLAILGFFKYYGFFLVSFSSLLETVGLERDLPFMQVILPIGISFFTFQGISYVVDIYRAHVPAGRSLLNVMLYISFFPQLVAGPIVRAADFLPQLHRPVGLTREALGIGVVLILSGLAKKMVIANYLATELVDPVFFDPGMVSGLDLLIGIYGYAVQIYCDFSGYSDIAIGVAALLGYRFLDNFNQPYRAASLQDFWRRWHISLSTWLRDYLYVPLGGNRGGETKTYRNLFLTMFLGGIWHGAAWTFVFWGGFHGAMLAVERYTKRMLEEFAPSHTDPGGVIAAIGNGARHVVGVIWTFHLVCFAWIFFRADSFSTASDYIAGFARWGDPSLYVTPFAVGLIAVAMFFQFTPARLGNWLARGVEYLPAPLLAVLFGGGIWLVWAIAPEGVAPFIYFQF